MKYSLSLLALFIVAALLFSQFEQGSSSSVVEPTAQEIIPENQPTEQQLAQQKKRQDMVERFNLLKDERKKLQMRISRLSSKLRRTRFPAEQGQLISQDMRGANYLLKNPKLLGAFRDIDEIDNELEKLTLSNEKLDNINALLKAQK